LKFSEELTVGCGRYGVAALSSGSEGISCWTGAVFQLWKQMQQIKDTHGSLTARSIMEQCVFPRAEAPFGLFRACIHQHASMRAT